MSGPTRKKSSRNASAQAVVRNETGPYTHVVVGDGSAALWTLATLLAPRVSGEDLESSSILWLKGAGAQLHPVVPGLDFETGGRRVIEFVARHLGWNDLEFEEGQFLREFRNKAFREPSWYRSRSAGPEQQLADRNDSIWEPEQVFAPLKQVRVSPDLATLENRIRAFVDAHLNCWSLAHTPIQSVETGDAGLSLVLGNGKTVQTQHLFFADRWTVLNSIEGLPRPLGFLRGRNPHSVLQAVLTHELPSQESTFREAHAVSVFSPAPKKMASLIERPTGLCFYSLANKDSGETVERQVWGYFIEGGRQSVWSIALEREEAEDNHHIAKKLRRIHQAVEKMFSSSTTEDESTAAHQRTEASQLPILEERVAFEEARVFASGAPLVEPLRLAKLDGFWIATDGYGTSSALSQVEAFCEVNHVSLDIAFPEESDAETETVNRSCASESLEQLSSSSKGSSGSDEVVNQ